MPRSAIWRRIRAPGRRQQLLAEPLGGDFVNLEQRFAFGSARLLLVALLQLGQRHAEPLCQLFHGVLKADLLVELEELDDVAAGAAPEAVEESLVPVDLKRRCLLPVKRAQSLVGRARLLQRHVVLDHDDDVGCCFRSSMNWTAG